MIKISVANEIQKAMGQLQTLAEAQQFRFSVARALTMTAADIQKEVRKNLPDRFTLRRPAWIKNGIMIERATKENLTTTVYSRDKFMGLQEIGGTKGPLNNYLAVPTRMVKRTPTDMIRKSDRPKALGDKVEVVDYKGHKYLALKKGRKGNSGNQMRLLYLLIPRADIKKRLGLGDDAIKVARQRFGINLRDALEAAMRPRR